MVNIPMKSSVPINSRTVMSLNDQRNLKPQSSATIAAINRGYPSASLNAQNSAAAPNTIHAASSTPSTSNIMPRPMAIPDLINPIQKGQKFSLESNRRLTRISAKLGWNVQNPDCDVDVSAFLLNQSGKVIGDNWFVFYGQETSPDGSTVFSEDAETDRELIQVNFTKLNPSVSKIVFVLTINEAFEKRLNFSMLKDAYIRIMDETTNSELVSFKMTDYYSNVISMMIGELYLHNGNWKFNAIGNGVSRDLAGLCELYGVQVV